MEILQAIAASVEGGDVERTGRLTQEAIGRGVHPIRILQGAILTAMTRTSERFRRHEIFLPDMLLAAQAFQAGLRGGQATAGAWRPTGVGHSGAGTVQGDLHDIGKNLVGVLLRATGFEVIDLGRDVPARRFVEAAQASGAAVIGMSALLTTTMPRMREVMLLLEQQKLRRKIKTIVGGAPVSAEFAEEIGADAYGYDAGQAVVQVKALVGQRIENSASQNSLGGR